MNVPIITEDDIWEFLIWPKKRTNLPMVVCLADSLAEKGAGVYFYDSYDSQVSDEKAQLLLPVDILTLEVPVDKIQTLTDADIKQLQIWVKQNQVELAKLLNGASCWDIVYDLRPIETGLDPDVQDILNESFYCTEMPNLSPDETGLPVNIYISGRHGAKHGARIKFQNDYDLSKVKRSDFVTMTVSDSPKIPTDQSGIKIKLKKRDLELIKRWILLNRELLIALYKDQIDEFEAKQRIQKIKVSK